MAKSKPAKAGKFGAAKYVVLAQDDGTKDIHAYTFRSKGPAKGFAYVIGGETFRIEPV